MTQDEIIDMAEKAGLGFVRHASEKDIEKFEHFAKLIASNKREKVKGLSETTARTTIGMMRSMASHKPISPFHLMAADEMEQLLEEVLKYRKEKNNG